MRRTVKKLPRRRVLVVDDEQTIADTLATILCGAGYDAIPCYDAPSALQNGGFRTPDLLITDVVMPGMNGVALAIEWKRRWSACGVLLFSAMGVSFDLVEQARREGHDFEILAKPIHPIELLSRVAATLSENEPSRLRLQRLQPAASHPAEKDEPLTGS
jgi:DNA-binding response OmpR family regulator